MYVRLAWLAKMSETLVLSWGSLNIWRMICSIGVIPTHSSAIDYCHQLTRDKRNFINSKVGIWTGLNTITILHKELHWLNVHERTNLVWWCTGICVTRRLGTSLITSSQPLTLLLGRLSLRSANLNRLTVPRCRLSMYDSLRLVARWTEKYTQLWWF